MTELPDTKQDNIPKASLKRVFSKNVFVLCSLFIVLLCIGATYEMLNGKHILTAPKRKLDINGCENYPSPEQAILCKLKWNTTSSYHCEVVDRCGDLIDVHCEDPHWSDSAGNTIISINTYEIQAEKHDEVLEPFEIPVYWSRFCERPKGF